MSFLRKILRIFLVAVWFVISSVLCRCVNHGRKASERSLIWTLFWAKVTAKILDLKITPAGDMEDFCGGLIAANHQSALDILVLAALFRIRFSPKAEVRRWPLIGFMTQCNDPVWIDRSTPGKAGASARAMSETMKNGQAMLVFPEGTVSDGKNGLLPFKSTSFQAVLDSRSKVLPVIVSYDAGVRSQVQWVGDRSFLSHVWQVIGLKKVCVTVYIMKSVSPEPEESRKELAARVYGIMDQKWRSL